MGEGAPGVAPGRTFQPERYMQRSVGFIGLGNMGGAMLANLARAGQRVVVYDVAPAAVQAAAALPGVEAAGSTGEVAGRADVLFTVLPNDAIVRSTYLDPAGLAQRGR